MTDFGTQEHVMILWIVLGDRYLRAHNGQAYYYASELGCWEVYGGLLPAEVFVEVKEFLLALEGLFRSLKPKAQRTTEAGLIEVTGASYREHATFQDAITRYTDNAIFSVGNHLLKGGGKGFGKDAGPADDGDQEADYEVMGAGSWHILTAKALSRVAARLQSELLGNTLLKYFIEWCATPESRTLLYHTRTAGHRVYFCLRSEGSVTKIEFFFL